MARWRLTAKHYLNVPGTEWEHKETDRNTGKQARKVYPVPLHLEPSLPADQNYPGEVIVCYEGKGLPRDIVFEGKPTPDMEPLDAEAEAISAAESANWIHPIDSLPIDGAFGEVLIKRLEQVLGGQKPPPPSASDPVPELMKQIQLLSEQVAALTAKAADPEPALEDVVPTPQEYAVEEKRAARRA